MWIYRLAIFLSLSSVVMAETPSADRGYEILRERCFLPPDFDEAVLADLWTVWPEPERSQAEAASPDDRRRLTFSYYGLVRDPDDATNTRPALGYVNRDDGQWVMTCLACHAGKVAGQVIPGVPNSHIALQTLTEDVRLIKLKQRKPLAHLDLASLKLPLNQTNGTTNSVIFGVVLGTYRRPDMSVDLTRLQPTLVHHDVDPPAFWNVRKKTSLYADGFAPKTHRPLMQFMLLPANTRDIIYGWENDFRAILDWIEAVPVPRYPGPVDEALAERGRAIFDGQCARCHGTYGPEGRYVQQTVPWDTVRTDPVRLEALTVEFRRWMQAGWMSHYGEDEVVLDPGGYVAPPLDGVWASGPYFHNGSVPTLWHVLHPAERPVVWKRTEDGYDHRRVGLEVEELSAVPDSVKHPAHRRRYFDTALPGKNAGGHDFPDVLTEEEKHAVLEYLKTL